MTNAARKYLDLHVLQTVPPSCVNRDDTNSPKTAVYGGVTRARVSSQSWKQAMRLAFRDIFDQEMLGLRSQRIPFLLAGEIAALDPSLDADALSLAILEAAGVPAKKDKKSGEFLTNALFFISQRQLHELARIACESPDAFKANKIANEIKSKCHDALTQNPSIDLALFGRMAADDPSLNYDAAAQVAHSISTHAVHNEYDYFTAVDDRPRDDNAGAAHLGTVEFNSSTLYRYATLNVTALEGYIGPCAEAVRGFVRAFVTSMPSGKQNTFANRTVPDLVYAVLRSDQPVNLAGAFEQPLPASAEGYVGLSATRLFAYANEICANFVEKPDRQWLVGKAPAGCELKSVSLKEMLNQIAGELGGAAH